MILSKYLCSQRWLTLGLAGFFLGLIVPKIVAADLPPVNGEFDGLGKAVVQLLQASNTMAFATNLSVSPADWHDIMASNLAPDVREKLESYAKTSDYGVARIEAQARALLAQAARLHLDFSKGELPFQIDAPDAGQIKGFDFGDPKAGGVTTPYLDSLEITLHPSAYTNDESHGEFKVALYGLQKFPEGWRLVQGFEWETFPTNLLNAEALHVMAVMDRVNHRESVGMQDDPTLQKFGQTLVDFIRTGDTNIFVQRAFMTVDQLWAQFQSTGRLGYTREGLDKDSGQHIAEQIKIANLMFQQMADAGIDFTNADIRLKNIVVEHVQPEGPAGGLDGLMGEECKVTFTVKSDGKSKTGVSVSGDYTAAVNSVMRFGDDWRIMATLRWDKFPQGVVSDEALAKLKFENYVTEHGQLPTGMAAPEIEFTTLTDGKKMKLSDLRGKVVLLDFWATWCGPCQQPMAELQKIRAAHADWGDKVAIVPLSIDNTINLPRKHVNQRGWTNTFNVWAGDGGWASAPAKTYRLSAVPTTYIIDPQGKIAMVGQPSTLPIAKTIDDLLKK